jgi:hypothetical protein
MRFLLAAMVTVSSLLGGPLEDHWKRVSERLLALEKASQQSEPDEAESEALFRGMEDALKRAGPVQSLSPKDVAAGVRICGMFYEEDRWNPSVIRFLRQVSGEVVELDNPLAQAKGKWSADGWAIRIGASKLGLAYLTAAKDPEALPIFVRGLRSTQMDIVVQSIRGLARLSDVSHLDEVRQAAVRAVSSAIEFRAEIESAGCEGPELMCRAVKGN